MRQARHLFRNEVVLIDKQGELRTKKARMHPVVLFSQQIGLIGAVWLAILLFVFIERGSTKELKNYLTKIKVQIDKAFINTANF